MGEGDDAQKSAYTTRLAELKKVGDAVEKRMYEFENRPQYITGLRTEISNWMNFVTSTDEKFSHIPEEERLKVKAECDKATTWLASQLATLESQPKHVDVNVTCQQMVTKAQEISKFAAPIMNKAKPKPPKEERKEEKKDEMADDTKEEAPA